MLLSIAAIAGAAPGPSRANEDQAQHTEDVLSESVSQQATFDHVLMREQSPQRRAEAPRQAPEHPAHGQSEHKSTKDETRPQAVAPAYPVVTPPVAQAPRHHGLASASAGGELAGPAGVAGEIARALATAASGLPSGAVPVAEGDAAARHDATAAPDRGTGPLSGDKSGGAAAQDGLIGANGDAAVAGLLSSLLRQAAADAHNRAEHAGAAQPVPASSKRAAADSAAGTNAAMAATSAGAGLSSAVLQAAAGSLQAGVGSTHNQDAKDETAGDKGDDQVAAPEPAHGQAHRSSDAAEALAALGAPPAAGATAAHPASHVAGAHAGSEGQRLMSPIADGIFVRQGSLRTTPSFSSFHVVLQPQSLGMVTVHVERRAEGLQVILTPQRVETQALLDKHLPELAAMLRDGDGAAPHITVVAPGSHADTSPRDALPVAPSTAAQGGQLTADSGSRGSFAQQGQPQQWALADEMGGEALPVAVSTPAPLARAALARARSGASQIDFQA